MPTAHNARTSGGEGALGESQDSTPVTRSDIWLEDGSIILQAENMQFKVHRGLLARLSPIFADVFSVPQPAPHQDNADLVVDGCTILQLQDSAQDVQYLLSALYDQQYHAAKQPIPFEACRALLRLGRKYEIQTLFNEAVSRLKRDIPTSLAEYDKMSIPNDWTEFVSTPTLLYQIAEFCQRSCIPEIRCALPLIYFWCCSQDVYDMVKGHDFEEGGTVVKIPPMAPEVSLSYLAGRQKLIDRFHKAFSWVDCLGRANTQCARPNHCSKISSTIVNVLWRPEPHLDRILDAWPIFIEDLAKGPVRAAHMKKLCTSCFQLVQDKYSSERVTTWNELPSYFDLPSWDVLNGD